MGKDLNMKRLFLVKKHPGLPPDGDNWIVMDLAEFVAFCGTEEGRRRKREFGQLDGCGPDDTIVYVECGRETAARWRAEKDHHDYLSETWRKSGSTMLSLHETGREGQETVREDFLIDRTCDVEETAVARMMREALGNALTRLNPAERDLVENMYLSDEPMNEREYGERVGMKRADVHYRKTRVLKKLRRILDGKE